MDLRDEMLTDVLQQAGMGDINHPVAVIAILAGLAVFLREVSWFTKTIRGKNGTAIEHAMQELSQTLERLNAKMDESNHLALRNQDLLTDIRAEVRGK